MEAKNNQNREKVLPIVSINNNSISIDENVVTGDLSSYWKSPSKWITNMAEFLKGAKGYEHHRLLVDVQQLEKVEKIVPVIVVDKGSQNFSFQKRQPDKINDVPSG